MIRQWSRVQFLLVPLALLVSAAVPLVATPTHMMLFLGGILGLIGAAVVLLNPGIGFAVMIFASHFVPYEIGTGTQTGINPVVLLVAAFTGVWVLDQVILKRQIEWFPSKTFVPLIWFSLAAFVSFLVGQLRWFAASGAPMRAQIGGLAIYIVSVLAYIVFAQQIRSAQWLKWLCWVFIAMGVLHMLTTYYLNLVIPGWIYKVPFLFKRGTSGSVLWIWLTLLPLGMLLYDRQMKLIWKAALVMVILGVLYYRGIATREWSSGWIPPLIGIGVMLALRDIRLTAVMALGGIILIPIFGPTLYNELVLTDNEYSVLTRLEAARVLLEVISVSPIFGLGPANYYWYTPLFGIMGYYVTFNSHNNYVDLAAQSGIVSLIFFFWFFINVTLLGWRLRSNVQDGFSQGFVAACLAAIPAILVSAAMGDWVIPFTYNLGMSGLRSSIFTWMFLAGLVVLERQLANATTNQGEQRK